MSNSSIKKIKRASVFLVIMALMIPLVACGEKKPKGTYASCIKIDGEWLDLESRYEINGSKVIENDINGKMEEGTITYEDDQIIIEFASSKTTYRYDADEDILYNTNSIWEQAGTQAALVKMNQKSRLSWLLIGIIVTLFSIMLTGCKSAEVKDVEKRIDNAYKRFESNLNGENNYLSYAIAEVYSAERKYNSLSDKDKQKVSNKEQLDTIVAAADMLIALETGNSALELEPAGYVKEEINVVPPYVYITNTGICIYKDIKIEFTLYDRNKKETGSEVVTLDETLEPGDYISWFGVSGRLKKYTPLADKYFSVKLFSYTQVTP